MIKHVQLSPNRGCRCLLMKFFSSLYRNNKSVCIQASLLTVRKRSRLFSLAKCIHIKSNEISADSQNCYTENLFTVPTPNWLTTAQAVE